jgi:hypothetical protein
VALGAASSSASSADAVAISSSCNSKIRVCRKPAYLP